MLQPIADRVAQNLEIISKNFQFSSRRTRILIQTPQRICAQINHFSLFFLIILPHYVKNMCANKSFLISNEKRTIILPMGCIYRNDLFVPHYVKNMCPNKSFLISALYYVVLIINPMGRNMVR